MFDFLTVFVQKIGAAIGVGLVAIGGLIGGQPVSYKSIETEAPVVIEMPIQASSSSDNTEEVTPADDSKLKNTKQQISPVPLKAAIQEPSDVCSNIEGIQTTVPAGFLATANVCTVIEVKDLCPNLTGIQDKVPIGKSFVPRYNECLSEVEIDAKLNAEYAKENAEVAASAKEQQCISAKEKKHSLTYQIEAIYEEYRIKIEAARLNPEGKCCGAVERDLSALSKERSAKVSPLQSDMKKADADIQLYCY